jgi:hypothetical protein
MHDDNDDDDDVSVISHGQVQYWRLYGGGASKRHHKTRDTRKQKEMSDSLLQPSFKLSWSLKAL